MLSVCPPHAALEVAREVAALGFAGVFVDANAVSPMTAGEIARAVCDRGAAFVDGGIIGPPAHRPSTTRLYLSGSHAAQVAELFTGSLLDAVVLGDGACASALKMAYAAYTKGSAALLLAIRGFAEHQRVTSALLDEWDLSQPGLRERTDRLAGAVGPKAWRFSAEMQEIAESFEQAELPGGFHRAAAAIYERLSELKEAADEPSIDTVLELLGHGPTLKR